MQFGQSYACFSAPPPSRGTYHSALYCVLQVEEAVKLPGLLYVLPTVPNPMNLMLYSSCKIPGLIYPP